MVGPAEVTLDPVTASPRLSPPRPGIVAVYCVSKPLLRVIELDDNRAMLGRLTGG